MKRKRRKSTFLIISGGGGALYLSAVSLVCLGFSTWFVMHSDTASVNAAIFADTSISNVIFDKVDFEYNFKITKDGLIELDSSGNETDIFPTSGTIRVTLDINVSNIPDKCLNVTEDKTIFSVKTYLTPNLSDFLTYINDMNCISFYWLTDGNKSTSYTLEVTSQENEKNSELGSFVSNISIDVKTALDKGSTSVQLVLIYSVEDDSNKTIKSYYDNPPVLTFKAEAVVLEDDSNA